MSPGSPPRLDDASDPGVRVGSVPVYRFPEAPARALARMWRYRSWLNRPRGRLPQLEGVDGGAARAIVAPAQREGRRWLTHDENARLLAAAGVTVPRYRLVGNADEAVAAAAELGSVAVKAVALGLIHKTDVGGVALDLRDGAAVRAACERMAGGISELEGFLVQEMVPAGTEVVVGLTFDPTFGSLVAFGLGGTEVELLRDVAFRIAPLTDIDAHDLVESIRGYPLLAGYRGRAPTDIAAIEDLVLRVSWLAETVPDIEELDLNPVRVFPSGGGLAVVDVRTAIRSVRGRASTNMCEVTVRDEEIAFRAGARDSSQR